MNISERESRELLYKRNKRKDRALEVSVIAMAGLVIVGVALIEWWRS